MCICVFVHVRSCSLVICLYACADVRESEREKEREG